MSVEFGYVDFDLAGQPEGRAEIVVEQRWVRAGTHEADSSRRRSPSSLAFQARANAEITSAAVMLPNLIPRGLPA